MAHQYRIPKELREQLNNLAIEMANLGVDAERLAGEVRQAHESHSEVFEAASESYQEGERGQVVGEWISSIDTLADGLDDLGNELGIVTELVEELADKPEG